MSDPAAATSPAQGRHEEYTRRLERRRELAALWTERESWVGRARLAVFALILVASWLAFGSPRLSPWWIAVPAVGFFALVVYHDRVRKRRDDAGRGVTLYEKGIARLEDRWAGQGNAGERFVDPGHPYSSDLDLFGAASLFERLCLARTRQGEDALARWLAAGSAHQEIEERQQAVQEMSAMLDLRERLALVAGAIPAGVDFGGLAEWGQAPVFLDRPWLHWLGSLLALGSLTTLTLWLTQMLPWEPFVVCLAAGGGFAFRHRHAVRAVIKPVEKRAAELRLLAGLLGLFERAPFTSTRLRTLQSSLLVDGLVPSAQIRRLHQQIDWLNARRNQFFAPLALLLLWKTRCAFTLEAWRRRVGPSVRGWLGVVGELEAISSLASYRYERPQDVFPEILAGGLHFDGAEIGHPLLPDARCVRNSVRLDEAQRVLLISGSNMSGKSTLLRTVGINTVLALAGAPVRAARLRVSLLQLGGTLRIQDSLQAGRSRFYAEIQRIRELLDLTRKAPPLLFLLDELLQGTNSHDRRIGAEAVLRGLLDAGAIGLMTTHDLAITRLDTVFAPVATNVHFQDDFDDGHMTFSYRMYPGVVEKSNAIALMRAIGIPVAE